MATVGVVASRPGRVLVVGPPGVGKSWVAGRLALSIGLPHVELDGFKLKSGRQLASAEEVEAGLRAAVAEDRWVLDGNWSDDELARRVWGQADLVVWLDLPRHKVMRQVAWRSVRRVVTQEAYHGWNERLRDWVSPTHPMRWSWKMVAVYRDRYRGMAARLPSDRVVHVTSRSGATRLVDQLR